MTDILRQHLERDIGTVLMSLKDGTMPFDELDNLLDECEATLSWTEQTRAHVLTVLYHNLNALGIAYAKHFVRLFGEFKKDYTRLEPFWEYPDLYKVEDPHLVTNNQQSGDYGLSIIQHSYDMYDNGTFRSACIQTLQGVKGKRSRSPHSRLCQHIIWSSRPLLQSGVSLCIKNAYHVNGESQRRMAKQYFDISRPIQHGRDTYYRLLETSKPVQRILESDCSPLDMTSRQRKKFHN